MSEPENFDHHKPCRWEPSISPEELAEDLEVARQTIGDRFVDQYELGIAKDAMKLMEHMAGMGSNSSGWSTEDAGGSIRQDVYVKFSKREVG